MKVRNINWNKKKKKWEVKYSMDSQIIFVGSYSDKPAAFDAWNDHIVKMNLVGVEPRFRFYGLTDKLKIKRETRLFSDINKIVIDLNKGGSFNIRQAYGLDFKQINIVRTREELHCAIDVLIDTQTHASGE